MSTELETNQLRAIADRLTTLRAVLSQHELPSLEQSARWYELLSGIKRVQGNLSNDIHFVATLLAQSYLAGRFDLLPLDAAAKPQGAPGLDIDVQTTQGQRIVGEIKTTIPYGRSDFGSQQKVTFEKDFKNLASERADSKFMFVTEDHTFDILASPRYLARLPGVCIVQLLTHREHAA